ncbi:MAG: hypothetical protein A3F11_00390 [Gammaproteobacteria bacterium RIFCSPHIGHO2_12_FULL_37_14]|nr:MAG: hypothetical protein A3F11_00390 [Gammaproteobacteria bacterium RIFCSPHIGHO2_12_FULL_37_14]
MNMSDEKMLSQASVDQNTKAGLPAYLNQVFLWMMFALALSGSVAYLLGQHPVWEEMIVSSNTRLNVLWLLQLGSVQK